MAPKRLWSPVGRGGAEGGVSETKPLAGFWGDGVETLESCVDEEHSLLYHSLLFLVCVCVFIES